MENLNSRHHADLRNAEYHRIQQTNSLKLWIIALVAVAVLALTVAKSESNQRKYEEQLHRDTAAQLAELRANVAGGFPINIKHHKN